MAGEKSSRSKVPGSRSKRTKDTDADVDAKLPDNEVKEEERVKKNSVGNGESLGDEKKQRKSKKRKLGEEDDRESFSTKLNKVEGAEGHNNKRKKSVSFSLDTRVEVEAEEASDETGDASKKETKKKKKEKKKSKDSTPGSTNNDSTSGPKSDESAILSYLDLYHNDRSAWKFQKIRETQLFKHILSLKHVPDKYEAALLAYLRGLKGEAAKQRLREVAGAAIKADVEETKPEANIELSENPSEDQAASALANYRKAVYALRTKLTEGELTDDLGEFFQQLDAELLERFRKRRRAEIILFAVDGRVFTMSNLKAPPQKGKNAAQNQPGKKKKNRTAIVEISSSSESDSDSDAPPRKETKPTQSHPVKKKKNRTAIVEISSSSESSSSSDSDSDSSSLSSSS